MDDVNERNSAKISLTLSIGEDSAAICAESTGKSSANLDFDAGEAFKAMSEAILRSKLCTINGDETETTYQDWLKGKMK